MPDNIRAAHSLEGLQLSDGWRVGPKLPRPPGGTGGVFSVGYVALHEDGRKGYLKALDFSEALGDLRELQRLLEEYNFERDILSKCRDKGLSRVATALAEGNVVVPNYTPPALATVHYLIFEYAIGDVRSQMQSAHFVWCLAVVHHIAVALRQLHSQWIAHQDVKPSNVLMFDERGSKLGDLGRASDRVRSSPHDEDQLAGDPAYAPPEILYRSIDPDWSKRRLGCDLYLLGSLIVYMFTSVGTTAAVISRMRAGLHYMFWDMTFDAVLPHWRLAFDDVVSDFRRTVHDLTGGSDFFANELTAIVRQLCEPDPTLRGRPSALSGAQYDLERYISRLDLLRRRAEIQLGVKR